MKEKDGIKFFILFIILVLFMSIVLSYKYEKTKYKNIFCCSKVNDSYYVYVDENHYNCCYKKVVNIGNGRGYSLIEECVGFTQYEKYTEEDMIKIKEDCK
ncbi:MAG: hypothetical protein WC758_08140 [Candidatus Woesearchaeota archaeon]|jgi:uncharacterized protein (UPF0333 family)